MSLGEIFFKEEPFFLFIFNGLDQLAKFSLKKEKEKEKENEIYISTIDVRGIFFTVTVFDLHLLLSTTLSVAIGLT